MSTEKNAALPTPEDVHAATHKSNQKIKVPDQPTMMPPSLQKDAGLVTGQKVVGTFGSANALNQWLNITGAGFRKITNSNANAHMAICIIGNEAYEKQSSINYSLDANNLVQEIYAW